MATAPKSGGNKKLYVGVDVGGTKILAAAAWGTGRILSRCRIATPRGGEAQTTVDAIGDAIEQALADAEADPGTIQGVGLAVPGVIDQDGRVVFAPNTNLGGASLTKTLSDRLGAPVVIGNDVNCGTLGEAWLGSGSGAANAVGMFVGTGIGGGIIVDGKLLLGRRGAAAELGHIVMQIAGPLCGCGEAGCLEALASRTAMERDIRAAMAAGRQTVLTELAGGELTLIKSGMLKKALRAGDEIVTEVMAAAAEVLGQACLSIRHLFDPDVIVLGGGVIEACELFMMPIIERVVAGDRLLGPGPAADVRVSALGDDAVVLGALALAQRAAGRDPLANTKAPAYPTIEELAPGHATVAGKTFDRDVFIRADGKIRSRKKLLAKLGIESHHEIGLPELVKVCANSPRQLVVARTCDDRIAVTDEGLAFLRRRGIELLIRRPKKAINAFNNGDRRRAAILHVAC